MPTFGPGNYDPYDYWPPSGIGTFPDNIGFRAIGWNPGNHPYTADVLDVQAWGWLPLNGSLATQGFAAGTPNGKIITNSNGSFFSAVSDTPCGALWYRPFAVNFNMAWMVAEGAGIDPGSAGSKLVFLLRYDPGTNTGYRIELVGTGTGVTYRMLKCTNGIDWVLIEEDVDAPYQTDELGGFSFRDGAFFHAPLFHDMDTISEIYVPGQQDEPVLNTILVDPYPLIRSGYLGIIFYNANVSAGAAVLNGIEVGTSEILDHARAEEITATSARPAVDPVVWGTLLEVILVDFEDRPDTPGDFSSYTGDYYRSIEPPGSATFFSPAQYLFDAATDLDSETGYCFAFHFVDKDSNHYYSYAPFETPT